jgi:hypothetical protein
VPRDVTAHITYGRDATYTETAHWSIETVSLGLKQGASDRVCVEWEKLPILK